MKITEFLLRVKLYKKITYLQQLTAITQLQDLSTITERDIQTLILPQSTKQAFLSAMTQEESANCIYRLKAQCEIISFFDDRYPTQLREIYKPPLLLFARGNCSLLQQKITTVVGSRHPTRYSQHVLSQLIPNLVHQNWVIASGLARGVDGITHQETLKSNGKTIAVIGNGLNHFYPKENAELQSQIVKTGLLLSEYLPDTPPRPFRFPERNRILAGLAENVVVTEAAHHSGSLITANLALQENRNIYAVPGAITNPLSQGPNELIAAGAQPLISFEL